VVLETYYFASASVTLPYAKTPMTSKTSSGTQLYSILSRIWQAHQSTAAIHVFAEAFSIEESPEEEVVGKITQLFKLISDTKEDAICLEEKHAGRFLNAIQKVEKTFVDGKLLSRRWDETRDIGGVTEETLDIIYSYGDKLIDKGKGGVELTVEEVQALHEQLNELINEVIQDEDIDQDTKFLLVSELRKVEEVIVNYQIRGASGLEKVGNSATGSLIRVFYKNDDAKAKAAIHKVIIFVLSAVLQTTIGDGFKTLTGFEEKALAPGQARIESQSGDIHE
jgi:hypothetical protein